jgi:oligopeptidase B
MAQKPTPPATKKGPKTFTEHGRTRTDDYFWLNNPSDSNVISHLNAENAYTAAYLQHTRPLQEQLYKELVERIPARDESLPVKENGYWYYSRVVEGAQYPAYYRKKGTTTAQEELILNVNEMAKGHQIFLVGNYIAGPDNKVLAYLVDTLGNRRNTIHFQSLGSAKIISEVIPNASYSLAWVNDNQSLYYTLNDHTVRSFKVMRHRMGTDPSKDETILVERDSTFSVGLSASKDNRYIFINIRSTTSSESYYLDANDPNAKPVLIQQRLKDVLYSPSYREGKIFHILTNHQAKNFKLVTAPVDQPGIGQWKDLIPHEPKSLLQNVEVLKNYYVAQLKVNGLNTIRVIDRNSSQTHSIDFGSAAYLANFMLATDDYDLDSIRYSFMTITTPNSQYSYHLKSKERSLLKQQKVGGGFDASLYETTRIWVKAKDGTMVPVSLAYKKDRLKKDGSNPMLIYSYGSYGSNSDPSFNSAVISLLDRGFIYAKPQIRGGSDLGREWYEQGKLLNKKNTFTDFIDVAEFLVKEKYTSSDRLFANGVSAGGMLMGAITNMRPDLFRGIIAEVPWMDVISDMFDSSLPLTTLEYDEWGDPNKKEFYDYMITWSPLDNVKPSKFPAILATGGLHDTQVPYFSPAKWVARVREHNLGTNPVLFKVNMGAGHGGESGRYERQRLEALKMAFIIDLLPNTGEMQKGGKKKDF